MDNEYEHIIESEKGRVTFDLDKNEFTFEMKEKPWSGRGNIFARSGDDPKDPVDDLRKYDWSGTSSDKAFNLSFSFLGTTQDGGKNTGFDYACNVTRQRTATEKEKNIQIFGDVTTLERPVITPVEEVEFTPIALSTTGWLDKQGRLYWQERDSQKKYGPIPAHK